MPPLDFEMLAQQLHVADQVLRGVDAHVGRGIARVRGALPIAALVELHNQVAIGIEVAPATRSETGAGAPVDYQRGFAVRIAAGLPVDEVVITDFEQAVRERLNGRIRLHAAPAYATLADYDRPVGLGRFHNLEPLQHAERDEANGPAKE